MNEKRKFKTKTRKFKNKKGGNVIGSGGYGCVFNPALICKNTNSRKKKFVSKLLKKDYAIKEYDNIQFFYKKLKKIPNYENYFLINNISLCNPEKLSNSDLSNFNKCNTFKKQKITKKNINSNLNKLLILNLPNGGINIDTYVYKNYNTINRIYLLNQKLIDLLRNGIIPMNNHNIYHSDIKDINVLIDGNNNLKIRLIDWGLSTEYIPFKKNSIPKTWRNSSISYNAPFTIIIFTDYFVEKYKEYLSKYKEKNKQNLKNFVLDYINTWIKIRGEGHLKFINELLNLLDLSTGEINSTLNIIADNIVVILEDYIKIKNDILDLYDYLDNVFIKTVDIWGFITIYYPLLEILNNHKNNNNYNNINLEKQMLYQIKHIFIRFLYTPTTKPIDIKLLYIELDKLSKLLYI